MSKLSSKFYQAPTDQQGKAIQFDVREDEEQQTKFQETVELLVAAGYFRARIKGLSAFDKIVGGMTWCITTCNFDLDIDLLFQESSTIGQKIALVERIVSVLPRMKCPHRIEPHQIQGLDFIHIYPVIQWLVKKAIETRTEMGDLNRAFSLFQYSKTNNQLPNAIETSRTETARQAFLNLKESNAPQRKYIRKDFEKIQDRLIKIQSILLEYDQKNVLLSGLGTNATGNDTSSSNKLKQVAMDQQQQKQQQEQAKQQAIEAQEENLKRLMNEMSETGDRGGKGGAAGKISANTIGQILGLQQSQLQQIASEFDQKSSELQSEIDQIEKLLAASDAAGGKGLGGFQHKQRLANILNRQIEQKEAALNEKVNELNGFKEKSNELEEKITDVENKQRELRGELARLEEFERNADKKDVVELENLVKIHDENKQKENEYKKSCKAELEKIEERNQKLKELETSGGSDENEDEANKQQKILEQYKATKAKEHAVKLKIAKKNREISTLKRKLDEVPSRNELSQYQKRFLELYNQMSTFYIQTKQFYLLYNSQEDKRMHMNKVISLYNSINDQFAQAMSSQSNREQFVKQLETILDGIKNNLAKIDNRNLQRKNQLDKHNDTLIGLSDKKRSYFKALKDFQDECKKNELLQSKLQE